MIKYLLLFGSAAVLSWALTPLVRQLAIRLGVLDAPAARKVHQRPIPRWGGLAFVAAFGVVLALAFSPWAVVHSPWLVLDPFWWTGFLVAAGIIVGLGAVDDVWSLGAKFKLLVQLMAAVVAVAAGCVIGPVHLPGLPALTQDWVRIPVTILWIVGVTNAFNLIDGLDGLASGIGLISSLTLAAVGLLTQSVELALVGFVLAGALAGFLRYNFHPASIFMGDSGSLFLGFTLAVLTVRSAHHSPAAASLVIPLLACGLPITETLLSFARRFFRAMHLWETMPTGQHRFLFFCGRSIFVADREHIHHRLLRLGLTHTRCVVVLYGVCVALGLLALAAATMQNFNTGLLLAAVGWATVMVVRVLRYDELRWLRSGALLPLFRHRFLGQGPFQVLVDMGLIPLAYYVAYRLHYDAPFDGPIKAGFTATVPVILVTTLAVGSLTGLYRIKWSQAGLPDALRAIRSLLFAAVTVFGLTRWLPGLNGNVGVLVTDFFGMTALVLATRFSVRCLEHHRRVSLDATRRALIYGAGDHGSLAIRALLSHQHPTLIPVGFVDDAPADATKALHGYPILGPSHKLLAILRRQRIQELIVATPLGRRRLEALIALCQQSGVRVRRFHIGFVEP